MLRITIRLDCEDALFVLLDRYPYDALRCDPLRSNRFGSLESCRGTDRPDELAGTFGHQVMDPFLAISVTLIERNVMKKRGLSFVAVLRPARQHLPDGGGDRGKKALALGMVLMATTGPGVMTPTALAATGCTSGYGITSSWQGGSGAPATVTTPGDPPSGAVPRQKVNVNRGWKFIRSDVPEASNPDFDDSRWVPVALPHDFDAPYDLGGSGGGQSFHVGTGWYRRHFAVPSSWSGKRVEFESEGAFSVTDVWVNGTKVGRHQGGYTGFAFDITGAVRAGDNEISVRVDNVWRATLAPRTGDHQFSGGLYRDVFLNVTDDVHVTWYGTAVTTPALTNPSWDTSSAGYYRNIDLSQYPNETDLRANVSARRSNVRVRTEVRNDRSSAVDVYARQEVRRQVTTATAARSRSPRRTRSVPRGRPNRRISPDRPPGAEEYPESTPVGPR
jgi:hypothetical protein